MNVLRSLSTSAGKCLESMKFSVIRASIERETIGSNFWGVSRNEGMHRMRTMARLHESLFRIQMEIEEYDAKYETLRRQAENSFYQKASESQQKHDFNKMRLVELQKKALTKSENILLFTLNGLEKKGYIQNINNIIQYTVKQHKMVHEEGLVDDGQNENLIEAFDHITNNVAKGQDILEMLDAQSLNVENEQETDEGVNESDTAFGKWQHRMALEEGLNTTTTTLAPHTVNQQQDTTSPSIVLNIAPIVASDNHENTHQQPARQSVFAL